MLDSTLKYYSGPTFNIIADCEETFERERDVGSQGNFSELANVECMH